MQLSHRALQAALLVSFGITQGLVHVFVSSLHPKHTRISAHLERMVTLSAKLQHHLTIT